MVQSCDQSCESAISDPVQLCQLLGVTGQVAVSPLPASTTELWAPWDSNASNLHVSACTLLNNEGEKNNLNGDFLIVIFLSSAAC